MARATCVRLAEDEERVVLEGRMPLEESHECCCHVVTKDRPVGGVAIFRRRERREAHAGGLIDEEQVCVPIPREWIVLEDPFAGGIVWIGKRADLLAEHPERRWPAPGVPVECEGARLPAPWR